MTAREYRRVANQPGLTKTQADWEQLRRNILSIIAQFKAADPEGGYTLDVRLVPRDRKQIPA